MYISKSLSKRLFIFKVKRFATRLLFLGLLATLAHLVYYGIRTTLFNIPFLIILIDLPILHIILDQVRPPHQRTVWHI